MCLGVTQNSRLGPEDFKKKGTREQRIHVFWRIKLIYDLSVSHECIFVINSTDSAVYATNKHVIVVENVLLFYIII